MTKMKLPPAPTSVRPLSENEIHERLYGTYFTDKKKDQPQVMLQLAPAAAAVRELPAPPFARPASAPKLSPVVEKVQPTQTGPSMEMQWSGSEILTGELQRLRSELITLKQEKERLAVKLQRVKKQAPLARVGRWMTHTFASLLMLGGLGYIAYSALAGGAVLTALPSLGDPTPYTVQVAVYDNRVMADQARNMLDHLGYDAFLVEVPRVDGKVRYRIYVGSFVTKEEAARESDRLAADSRFLSFKDAFVLVR